MSLLALRDALEATGIPTYHFGAAKENERYIVWSEIGKSQYSRIANTETLWADDHMVNQTIGGLIDYFTPVEYDKTVDMLQQVYYDIGLSYSLVHVFWDEDVNRVHYQWAFSMPVGEGIYSETDA